MSGSSVNDFLSVIGLPRDLLGPIAHRFENTRDSMEGSVGRFCSGHLGRCLTEAELAVIGRLCVDARPLVAGPTMRFPASTEPASGRQSAILMERVYSARTGKAVENIARREASGRETAASERSLRQWWASGSSPSVARWRAVVQGIRAMLPGQALRGAPRR